MEQENKEIHSVGTAFFTFLFIFITFQNKDFEFNLFVE